MAGKEYSFEEYLAENGTLTYSNKGVSMLPLLKEGRDLFTVEARTSRRCRRYDVVLYRRPPDQYVLHRVLRVTPRGYVILGDNSIKKEFVRDEDILGVMTSFVRKGREYSVTDPGYRLYTRVWCCFLHPLKNLALGVRRCVGKLLR